METTEFRSYLAFLRELAGTLSQLTDIEQRKAEAVRQDDLSVLNECMKQEQALNLALRGYDQRRQAALVSLNLTDVPLGALLAHAPDECQTEARQTVEALRQQYELFHAAYEVARNTLEINLHQVEKVLDEIAGESSPSGPGYQEKTPEPPSSLRTDFRA